MYLCISVSHNCPIRGFAVLSGIDVALARAIRRQQQQQQARIDY